MAVATYEIAGGPSAAQTAREAADAYCRGLPGWIREDVRLLVSELVTNSVRHAEVGAADTISLRFAVDDRRMRVAVSDFGPGFEPRLTVAPQDAESGYGLYLVDRIADCWGVTRERSTCVWFEIERAPRRLSRAVRPFAAAGGRGLQLVLHAPLERGRAGVLGGEHLDCGEGSAGRHTAGLRGYLPIRRRRPPSGERSRFHSPRELDLSLMSGGGASPRLLPTRNWR